MARLCERCPQDLGQYKEKDIGCRINSTMARKKIIKNNYCPDLNTPIVIKPTSSLNTTSWDNMSPENKQKYYNQAPGLRSSKD